MPTEKNRTAYFNKYQHDHYKRVPLNLKFDEYEALKEAADACNEPVNTYIKKAINERIQKQKH